MAIADGASATLAIKKQTGLGAAPSGNFELIPAASFAMAQREPFLDNDLIGTGRDEASPGRGPTEVTGNATVPLDDTALPLWLSMLLGAPTTTGAGPDYVHTFTSGKDALVYHTIEAQHPKLTTPLYDLASDVLANTMTLQLAAAGYANAQFGLMATSAILDDESAAGTPTAYAGQRFLHQQATLQKDDSTLAKVLSGQITFDNRITVDRYISGGGLPGDFPLGLTDVGGEIVMRLNDLATYAEAIAYTSVDIKLEFVRSATQKVLFHMANVELAAQGQPLEGPAGVNATFQIKGFKTSGDPQSLLIAVTNEVASY